MELFCSHALMVRRLHGIRFSMFRETTGFVFPLRRENLYETILLKTFSEFNGKLFVKIKKNFHDSVLNLFNFDFYTFL